MNASTPSPSTRSFPEPLKSVKNYEASKTKLSHHTSQSAIAFCFCKVLNDSIKFSSNQSNFFAVFGAVLQCMGLEYGSSLLAGMDA